MIFRAQMFVCFLAILYTFNTPIQCCGAGGAEITGDLKPEVFFKQIFTAVSVEHAGMNKNQILPPLKHIPHVSIVIQYR